MNRKLSNRRSIARWVAGAVLLLVAAACGSGGGGGGAYGGEGASPTGDASSAGQTLRVASSPLGKVLVDGRGMTVYMLTSDKPGESLCPSACLELWPPVAALDSSAKPEGVTATVGSTADTSGNRMVTVGGWPLYTYVKDKAPGDVTGEGVQSFGGTWWAISPSGEPMKQTSEPSGY